ncbi:hypothetical protein ACFSC4_26300 [Deinococcus malanensis]|uniref:hypothetical protein n=1 Tax=Deinococcus malanensis TaxID=1706855 RepID=UPI003645B6D8
MTRREELVHQVTRRLGALSARRGGLALALWGEAGIGKSWVAAEILRALPLRSAEVHASVSVATLIGTLPRPARLPTWTQEALGRLEHGDALGQEVAGDALSSLLSELAPLSCMSGTCTTRRRSSSSSGRRSPVGPRAVAESA